MSDLSSAFAEKTFASDSQDDDSKGPKQACVHIELIVGNTVDSPFDCPEFCDPIAITKVENDADTAANMENALIVLTARTSI